MPAWTGDELDTIGTAEELNLASVRRRAIPPRLATRAVLSADASAVRSHDPGSRRATTPVRCPHRARGHSLTIDHGWHEVAQTALDFVKRFT
jgi:hypothetical protein